MPFSVLILTLNEERNLPGCLASLRGCADIVVLDSGSTDGTVELARRHGARVFSRDFDNFAAQRNYAQRNIAFANPWVFHLDADESMTDGLAAECERAAGRADVDGFYAAPRMMLGGKWIPRCTDFPAWQARYVRAPGFEFVEVGHGQREAPEMRMARLQSNYLHDVFSGGTQAEWLEKHRRYARAEAWALAGIPLRPAELFSPERLLRRRALKRLNASLPLRPARRFAYQYLYRRGFLDGTAGLRYCLLIARYEGFMARENRLIRAAR